MHNFMHLVIATSSYVYRDTEIETHRHILEVKGYSGKKLKRILEDQNFNTSTHYMVLGKSVNLYGLSYCHL